MLGLPIGRRRIPRPGRHERAEAVQLPCKRIRNPASNTMDLTFQQVEWSDEVRESAKALVRLAAAEDVGKQCDWTTRSLVPDDVTGSAAIVARSQGVVAGMPLVELVIDELGGVLRVDGQVADGDRIEPQQVLAVVSGSVADLLTAERIFLNFLGRLSGIASLTRQYVDAVAGTGARVYDTRKTTPGWRLLEKYAVRCGGGCNHRLGLHRAVMLKDNHVALAQQEGLTLPAAVERVRTSLREQGVELEAIEVEVDTLAQLEAVLPVRPDIVLLDNMSPAQLEQAVAIRDGSAPEVILEASGGVHLETIGQIAQTGVDRVSVGALTHSAAALDIGLDYRS